VIRPATEADASAISRVQLRGWRAAYGGFLGEEAVTAPARFAHRWPAVLRAAPVWVAEEGGEVVGFAAGGPTRDDDAAQGTGELYALYVDPSCWRRGLGRALHDRVLAELAEAGLARTTLWVLEEGGAGRRFYERQGWRPDGAAKLDELGARELRYARGLGDVG
jgi:ribosomal protein S18 acetylase RimI-like enzyme